jgi:hypothetical protein
MCSLNVDDPPYTAALLLECGGERRGCDCRCNFKLLGARCGPPRTRSCRIQPVEIDVTTYSDLVWLHRDVRCVHDARADAGGQ